MAPKPALRGDVQRLVAAGAQLVEVLPVDEYEAEHLRARKNKWWDSIESGTWAPGRAAWQSS